MLLEAIAFVVLVVVALIGFATAMALTFAIWFGNNS